MNTPQRTTSAIFVIRVQENLDHSAILLDLVRPKLVYYYARFTPSPNLRRER